jgi:putative copper export protein
VLLHTGIAIFMGLQLFAAIMIIFNTAAFGWPYMREAYMSIVAPRRLRRVSVIATQAFCSDLVS